MVLCLELNAFDHVLLSSFTIVLIFIVFMSFTLQVNYLQSTIYLILLLIPPWSLSHGNHHILYQVQLSLDIIYLLLVMEQLLTTSHQTVTMSYS